MTTLAFLILIASPPKTMFHATLGQDCSTIHTQQHDTEYDGITTYSTIGPLPFGEVRYLCWDGSLVTVEAKFSQVSGPEIRNNLSRRWGQSSYTPWVDVYSWSDEETMARLDYVDDGVLTLSDRGLLMAWDRARKPGLYGMGE